MSPTISRDVRRASDEALDHAVGLVAAAKLLLEPFPHLAYHFAALALEEVGRSTLLVLRATAQERYPESRRYQRDLEDHVRKLFWALWGPTFGRQLITGKQIEELRGLASAIHEVRKSGLYYGGPGAPPHEAISLDEAANLLEVAEARLGMAKSSTWIELSEEEADDMAWFIEASDDPEHLRLITGGKSMDKLVELGSVRPWIHWLRTQFEDADAAGRELLERELARLEPSGDERAHRKWRVKCRFESGSHSIRPKPLQKWNDLDTWLKLHPVSGKKDQIILDMELPKAVSIQALWWTALGAAQQFLVALNIGTRGFFWFHLSEKTSRFYEAIVDLESDAEVAIERQPALRIDWGRRALSSDELNLVALCIRSLPGPSDRKHHEPFNRYLTGLGSLAKTDVIMQFETQAFSGFYGALKEAARLYGRWDGSAPFSSLLPDVLAPFLKPGASLNAYRDFGAQLDAAEPGPLAVDLSQVAMMKTLTDMFLLAEFQRRLPAHDEITGNS